MSIYPYIYIYILISIYPHIHISINPCIHIYIYPYIQISRYAYMHISIYPYIQSIYPYIYISIISTLAPVGPFGARVAPRLDLLDLDTRPKATILRPLECSRGALWGTGGSQARFTEFGYQSQNDHFKTTRMLPWGILEPDWLPG